MQQDVSSVYESNRISSPMYAGFVARTLAYIIDSIFLTLIGIVGGLSYGILTDLDRLGMINAVSVAAGLATPFFLIGFWAMAGATPGKILFGMRIVGPSGRTDGIGFTRAFLRLIGYFISSFFLYLGFIWVAVDSEKRAWHDYIAGTRVIQI